MKQLRDKLVADLTASRPLSSQVTQALVDRCELDSTAVCAYLGTRLPDEDEAVIDTVFSPMFTPTWSDRARYVEDRERVQVTDQVLTLLVDDLSRAHLQVTLEHEDSACPMVLPEVLIDRWVQRLHLDVTLSDPIRHAILATVPGADQAMAKALAGHAGWRAPGREAILLALLTAFAHRDRFSIPKFEYLTGLIHTFRPRDVAQFSTQVDALIQSYHEESGDHFFDSHLKETYGPGGGLTPVNDPHGRDRRRQLTLATQIQEDLAAAPPAP